MKLIFAAALNFIFGVKVIGLEGALKFRTSDFNVSKNKKQINCFCQVYKAY
jgi:hypothetical protein